MKGGKIMRNRRGAITTFILVAVLIMGVGFATLTDTLTINGDLEIDAAQAQAAINEDIYFTAVEIKSKDKDNNDITEAGVNNTEKFSASIVTNDPDKITFNAKGVWDHVGQQVTVVATIINTGEHANKTAKLTAPDSIGVTANGDQYFRAVSKTYSASTSGKDVVNEGLPVGESCTLTIVFEYYAMPANTDGTTAATVVYTISATAE